MEKFAIYALVFLTVIASCRRDSGRSATEKFAVNIYSLKGYGEVTDVTFYNGVYYCNCAKGGLLCLTDKFEKDSTISRLVNKTGIAHTYASNDTLVGVKSFYTAPDSFFYLDDEFRWQALSSPVIYSSVYDDDDFFVTSYCGGCAGSSFVFKDRKDNAVYGFPWFCALDVRKLGSDFFVSAEMGGKIKILKITDPRKLHKISDDSGKYDWEWYLKTNYYREEERCIAGTETLVDTVDIWPVISFISSNNLYYITSTYYATYITKVEGNKLVTVDSIFYRPVGLHRPQIQRVGNMQVYPFSNYGGSGFLTIRNDSISIVTFTK